MSVNDSHKNTQFFGLKISKIVDSSYFFYRYLGYYNIYMIDDLLWFLFHLLLLCQNIFSATQKMLQAIKTFIKRTCVYME